MIENNDLTLTCDYNSVLPFGNESAFNLGDVSVTLNKVSSHVL